MEIMPVQIPRRKQDPLIFKDDEFIRPGTTFEALAKLRLAPFDVVITDLDMPRMTGQALCEAMAAELDVPGPLVLIVTGTTEPEARTWVSRFPNTEVLEKPLSLKRLVRRLEEHFESMAACGGSAA